MIPTAPAARRRPNYFYANVSLTLVLFLLGVFATWVLQAAFLGERLKESVDVLVELREGTNEVARLDLTQRLAAKPFAKPESVVFRPKEEALGEMGDEISRDLVALDLPNPFRDMLSFNVYAEQLNPDSLGRIALELGNEPEVLDVYYQEDLIGTTVKRAERFGWLLLGFGLLLVLMAVWLIHNLVRLSLYANRFLIKNQQLVGASWGFISRPYLRRAAANGLLCGLLAAGLLFGLQYGLDRLVPELQLLARPQWLLALYAALVILALVISWLSHYFTVRRYLKMRADDLY